MAFGAYATKEAACIESDMFVEISNFHSLVADVVGRLCWYDKNMPELTEGMSNNDPRCLCYLYSRSTKGNMRSETTSVVRGKKCLITYLYSRCACCTDFRFYGRSNTSNNQHDFAESYVHTSTRTWYSSTMYVSYDGTWILSR